MRTNHLLVIRDAHNQNKDEIHAKKIIIISFAMLTAGCATLFSPSKDTVSFESEQKGIEAFIEGKKVGDIPFSINLDHEVFKHKFITFKKPGYKTMEMRVKKA